MYNNVHHKELISYILFGNKLAAKELITRHKYKNYTLNPIVGKGNNSLFQLIVRKELTHIALDFIEEGVEVNTQNMKGMTPLHEAAINGNKILIEKLLGKGANPFICNEDGMTAGMLAEINGHKALAFRLSPSFLVNYPNLSYISSFSYQSNENQDKPLDLSKTAPNTINSEPRFFKPNKPSRLFPAEEVAIEIDPTLVLGIE